MNEGSKTRGRDAPKWRGGGMVLKGEGVTGQRRKNKESDSVTIEWAVQAAE